MTLTKEGIRAFVISKKWFHIKIAIRCAVAVAVALSISQNKTLALFQGSAEYLGAIVATIFAPMRPRGPFVELCFMSLFCMCAAVPLSIVMFACCWASRYHNLDLQTAGQIAAGKIPATIGLAAFYQGPPAAIAAAWIFILGWTLNVLKTRYVTLTQPVVLTMIISGLTILQGYLAPTWTAFFTLLTTVLKLATIAIAFNLVISFILFPFNAREPYLTTVADYLGVAQKMIALQKEQLKSFHSRVQRHRSETLKGSNGDATKPADNKESDAIQHAGVNLSTHAESGQNKDTRENGDIREGPQSTSFGYHLNRQQTPQTISPSESDNEIPSSIAPPSPSIFQKWHLSRRKESEKVPVKELTVDQERQKCLGQLRGLRAALIALSAALMAQKAPAKREMAYGHLNSAHIEEIAKLCRDMVQPLTSTNMWSELVELAWSAAAASEEKGATKEDDSHKNDDRIPATMRGRQGSTISVSESLNAADAGNLLRELGNAHTTPETEQMLLDAMENSVGPRCRALSGQCEEAITHICRVLHFGQFKRPPFWLRHLYPDRGRPDLEANIDFAGPFEEAIDQFWANRNKGIYELMEGSKPVATSLLLIYFETLLYETAQTLLKFVRFADELHNTQVTTKKRWIIPPPKRFIKAFRRAARHDRTINSPGDTFASTNTSSIEASDLIREAAPIVKPGNRPVQRFFGFLHDVRAFMESDVSVFGFRAAVAILVSATPAFFPATVQTFIALRLFWIAFTVMLGLSPIAGRAFSTLWFRFVGTIIGGVLSLVIVEIGRVPAGYIPIMFVVILPLFYLQVSQPAKYYIPCLLAIITMDLVVGYQGVLDSLGPKVASSQGQEVLTTPEIMGFRILLTLAGIFVAFIFSVFPSLPTSRHMLRKQLGQSAYYLSNLFLLYSVEMAGIWSSTMPRNMSKHIAGLQRNVIKLANDEHQWSQVAKFEPTLRGTYPDHLWQDILKNMDDVSVTLSLTNRLLKKFSEDPGHLVIKTIVDEERSARYHRAVASTLYNIGNSLTLWQSLPPFLPTYADIHIFSPEQAKQMSRFTREKIDLPGFAYLSSALVAAACMVEYIERLKQNVNIALGGESKLINFIEEVQSMQIKKEGKEE